MATGRSAKLTGQVGEFLVCAALGRCGIIATPFAGNVPEFDVVATGEGLVTVLIQVKASNGTSEQRLDRWLDVEYDARRRRHQLRRLGRSQAPLCDSWGPATHRRHYMPKIRKCCCGWKSWSLSRRYPALSISLIITCRSIPSSKTRRMPSLL